MIRNVPKDVRESREYGPADEHVQNLYRELRGRTIEWWPGETRADAVQRAAWDRGIQRPVAVIDERTTAAIERTLAVSVEHEDGGGTVTFVEYPPSVAAARAEKEAARAQRRAARPAKAPGASAAHTVPTGKQGGLTSTQRGRKRLHPEEFAHVPPGKPGRPKTVAPTSEKTVAESDATVFHPPSATGSAPPPRALAPTHPPLQPPLGGLGAGGGEAAAKTVARSPKPPKTVAPDPDLKTLAPERCGGFACGAFGYARSVFSPTGERGARTELGACVQAGGYTAHDLRVVGWHWYACPAAALARVSARLGKVHVVTELNAARVLADEHVEAQRWWHTLAPALRGQIERGECAPPRLQLEVPIPDNQIEPTSNAVGPPVAAPASVALGPGVTRTDERREVPPQEETG